MNIILSLFFTEVIMNKYSAEKLEEIWNSICDTEHLMLVLEDEEEKFKELLGYFFWSISNKKHTLKELISMWNNHEINKFMTTTEEFEEISPFKFVRVIN